MSQNEGNGCVISLIMVLWWANHTYGNHERRDLLRIIFPTQWYLVRQPQNWGFGWRSFPLIFKKSRNWISHLAMAVTPSLIDVTTVWLGLFAFALVNPALCWAGAAAITPESWRKVLIADHLGALLSRVHDWGRLSLAHHVFDFGLNLYMASENCAVNKRRHPRHKPSNEAAK
jgi:hypothetical protein